MSNDADHADQLAFADEVGGFFARQYGVPPVAGRVFGWLLVCDPPKQTIAELSDALRASRSAVSSAVSMLVAQSLVQRSRASGDRVDRIAVNPGYWEQGLQPEEYAALGALARRGIEALGDAPPARRALLLEMGAFADFLVERMPALAVEWVARRDALRAAGELQT
jgi:hypothetical protein